MFDCSSFFKQHSSYKVISGERGATGPRGVTGQQGVVGDQRMGPTGTTGSEGLAGPSGLTNIQGQILEIYSPTSSGVTGIYAPPEGTQRLKVQLWGAGGGGGGVIPFPSFYHCVGAGGGGGGYAEVDLLAPFPPAYEFFVAPMAPSDFGSGHSAVLSWFGRSEDTELIYAFGGSGGESTTMFDNLMPFVSRGGAGGLAGGIPPGMYCGGSAGGDGMYWSYSILTGKGGAGAFASGSAGSSGNVVIVQVLGQGKDGHAIGGGGSGAFVGLGPSFTTGGNGAPGKLIVTAYS